MNEKFAKEIREGLSKVPKQLSSKWLYDDRGSDIFKSIMALDEYYPTDCEFEIFQNQKAQLLTQIQGIHSEFNLIEFGAGDGKKTKILLKYFLDQKVDFKYTPIDISSSALSNLKKDLAQEIPGLSVHPINADYFTALQMLNFEDQRPKVILFLGSNIGNFEHTAAVTFLQTIRENVSNNDLMVVGFDLIKNPKTILAAYNDRLGVTKEFNMNLLHRINREFDADFDLMQFDHYPTYNISTGTVKSYLVSLKKQRVHIKKLDFQVDFEAWEYIHTEISQKYSITDIEDISHRAGFEVIEHIKDCKHYFTDSIWKAI